MNNVFDPVSKPIQSTSEELHVRNGTFLGKDISVLTKDRRLVNLFKASGAKDLHAFLKMGTEGRGQVYGFGSRCEAVLQFALTHWNPGTVANEKTHEVRIVSGSEDSITYQRSEQRASMPSEWDQVRHQLLLQPALHGIPIYWAALEAGADWPFNRRTETIGEYLGEDESTVRSRPGLGRQKFSALQAAALWLVEHPGYLKVESVSEPEVREEIAKLVARLQPEEVRVLDARIRRPALKRKTLEELGSALGLTRERVRQQETLALEKLRSPRLMAMLDIAFQIMDPHIWAHLARKRSALRRPQSPGLLDLGISSDDLMVIRIKHESVEGWLDATCKPHSNGWHRLPFASNEFHETQRKVLEFISHHPTPRVLAECAMDLAMDTDTVEVMVLLSDEYDVQKDKIVARGSSDQKWDTRFLELKKFAARNGHCRVTREQNPQLGAWVQSQRAIYLEGKQDAERINRLESLGFDWKLRERGTWDANFQKLKRFIERTGEHDLRKPSKADYHLLNWASGLRTRYRRGQMSPEEIKQLKAIGFKLT